MSSETHAALSIQGRDVVVLLPTILQRFGVAGLVRLHDEDFGCLTPGMTRLTHFNLAPTSNRVGLDYVLACILKAGFMDEDGVETLPLLDLSTAFLARCVEVAQPVALEDVGHDKFEWSLPTIRNTSDLRRALERRYGSSSAAGLLRPSACAISTFTVSGLVRSGRSGSWSEESARSYEQDT